MKVCKKNCISGLHHRIGGLENFCINHSSESSLHHRIGGLENYEEVSEMDAALHHRIGGLEMHLLRPSP